ncbi:MAG TPA: hypothetical protein VHJ39_16780, partial [Solirubrobacteraceae bacterium]|nr:hypothetical protein [Solirubrobacteraceae bacterium]
MFSAVGSGGRVVERSHDAISAAAYGAVRGTFLAGGRAVAAALRAHRGGSPLSATPRGGMLLGALNGLIGDELPALTRLAFDELGAAVGGIGSIHRGIAGRVFSAVGSGGRVVER